MAPSAVAAQLLASGHLRRWLGCGCVAAVATVGLPVFMLLAVASGMLRGFGASDTGQADGLAGDGAAVVVGTAEPLPAGQFTVSQGSVARRSAPSRCLRPPTPARRTSHTRWRPASIPASTWRRVLA